MVTVLYHLEVNGIFSLKIVYWFSCRFDWTFICEYIQVCLCVSVASGISRSGGLICIIF